MLAVGTLVPAAAQQPGAGAGAQQVASAVWIRMNGSNGTMYAADGYRRVNADGARTIGGVAKGDCTKTKTKHFTMITCMAMGRYKELALDQFQIDPALRSAEMTVQMSGKTHTVAWEAKELADFGTGAEAATSGASSSSGGFVRARAAGKVFGVNLAKGCSFCFLSESAGAGVSFGTRSLQTIRDDEGFQVRLRLKVPRS